MEYEVFFMAMVGSGFIVAVACIVAMTITSIQQAKRREESYRKVDILIQCLDGERAVQVMDSIKKEDWFRDMCIEKVMEHIEPKV